MAPRKRAEEFVRAMLKHYGWFWHKYGDVRYCIHCNQPLPKSENAPDFAAGICYTYIEAKNSDSTNTWKWTEISEDGARANQRKWLIDNHGWLFIELGEGRAPNGKSAYLVPFDLWVKYTEPILNSLGMKSIRKETKGNRPGADQLLHQFRLEWVDGEWLVPDNHCWWRNLKFKLELELERVQTHIKE